MNCNLSFAMIWQMTYTHKLPKLCSATLKKSQANTQRYRNPREVFGTNSCVTEKAPCLFSAIHSNQTRCMCTIPAKHLKFLTPFTMYNICIYIVYNRTAIIASHQANLVMLFIRYVVWNLSRILPLHLQISTTSRTNLYSFVNLGENWSQSWDCWRSFSRKGRKLSHK